MQLLTLGRFDMAEEELRAHLADEPGDGHAHALRALALLELGDRDGAEESARQAIAHEPDAPFHHYAMALVLLERRRMEEAEQAVREALRLDPASPHSWAVLGQILGHRRDWPAMLEAAERGLQHDPEHVECNNVRAMALTMLGRKDEAGWTMERTLAREPEDARSHANMGWTQLNRGDRKKALHHFQEALRLDPGNDWARRGMVEAIKAGNPLYALMLRYFLWMGKMSERYQWGFILAAWFGVRILRAMGRSSPEIAPYTDPLVYLYVAFVLLSWLSHPVSNLLLRLHPLGKHALDHDQRMQANLVGATLGLALLAVAGTFLLPSRPDLPGAALAFGLLAIPVTAIFGVEEGWPRRVMAGAASLTAFLALGGSGLLLMGPAEGSAPYGLAQLSLVSSIIGSVGSSWLGVFLAGRTPAR